MDSKLTESIDLSIIIPTLYEGFHIIDLITYLREFSQDKGKIEIIIVDGDLDYSTEYLVKNLDVVYDCLALPNRGQQMNHGVGLARSENLYFLHADTFPPENYFSLIMNALKDNDFGCFRLKFASESRILSFYSFFSRFRHNIFHGGDASLFVKKELFNKVGGFKIFMDLFEDYDLLKSLNKASGKFALIPDYVTTSDRRYVKNGFMRLQLHFTILQFLYRIGLSQIKLRAYYKSFIRETASN